jgi:hypothetical protein
MTEAIFRERLQAIIDWADLVMKNRAEFDSHGVRNLCGPVFDVAREALASAPSPEPKEETMQQPILDLAERNERIFERRYRALCNWYFRGGLRSEIYEHGATTPTTQAHLDQWADAQELLLPDDSEEQKPDDVYRARKPGSLYLVSALAEKPGARGHRARVGRFASRAEAIGSSLDLWQTDGFSVVSFECNSCDGLLGDAENAAARHEGWHSHQGMGDPDIPGDSLVQVCFRDGDTAFGLVHDWDQNWSWADTQEGLTTRGSIIAWRHHLAVWSAQTSSPQPDASPETVEDEWKEWGGDPDKPVGTFAKIQVKLRNGETIDTRAGAGRWSHDGTGTDVIAWRRYDWKDEDATPADAADEIKHPEGGKNESIV